MALTSSLSGCRLRAARGAARPAARRAAACVASASAGKEYMSKARRGVGRGRP